jgi:hypothetical protein
MSIEHPHLNRIFHLNDQASRAPSNSNDLLQLPKSQLTRLCTFIWIGEKLVNDFL